MPDRDSVDKIVERYFTAVTNEPFVYKGSQVQPKTLIVSPLLFRGFTCPEGCGACCPRFSLDYLPTEPHPYDLSKRTIEFDGNEVEIYSDVQDDHDSHFCRNLNQENGRCGIHKKRPFSCDFELIRPQLSSDPDKPNRLTQKLFGRKWAMKRVDGERGTRCEMLPADENTINEVERKLCRLEQWCIHFGLLDTKIPRILEWIEEVRASILGGFEVGQLTIKSNSRNTLL